jgi:MFS family permease
MEIKKENPEQVKKFAGLPIPSDLKGSHFFNLYFSTLFIACLMAIPAVIQPAYLKEVINIPKEQAGSINSGLQNMSQIATLLFVGFIGIISDRVGRRILVALGFVFCWIFFIVYGYTQEIAITLGITSVGGQVFIAYIIRFFIGVGIVLSFPQTTTMVADYTTPRDRGKGMALHGAMMGLGSMLVFGIMVQLARKTGLMSLFYMSGALGFLGFLVAWFGTVDRLPKEKAHKTGIKVIYQEVSKSLALKVGYIVTIITRADIAIVATFIILWMVYMADIEGITAVKATARGGLVMMVTSLVTLIAYPILGILTDRVGRIPVIIAGLLVSGAAFCLMAITNNPFAPIVYLYASLICVGFSGVAVASTTLTADASPKQLLGSILGGFNTMQPIGILFFLQVGGYLFDKWGYWGPFALKGIVSILCGLWIVTIRKQITVPQSK